MDDIRILEISNISVEKYRNLRLEALREEPQAFGSSYKDHANLPIEEWEKWHSAYSEGQKSWIVFAENKGQLVGMLAAFKKDDTADSVQIIAMYVAKNSRGKGISKLLMNKLIEKLTKVPVKKAQLDVNTKQIAAVNLYKNFGFDIIGKEVKTLGDGTPHEIYLMEKAL